MKHIIPGIPSIQEWLRCIMIWGSIIGGWYKEGCIKFTACFLCWQKVKVEHLKPSRLLQRLPIPEWKWERISMDFVAELPRLSHRSDTIWVIVDQLTKFAYLLPLKVSFSAERLAHIYIQEIVQLYGVSVSIISDRGFVFTSYFGRLLRMSWVLRLTLAQHFTPKLMVIQSGLSRF